MIMLGLISDMYPYFCLHDIILRGMILAQTCVMITRDLGIQNSLITSFIFMSLNISSAAFT